MEQAGHLPAMTDHFEAIASALQIQYGFRVLSILQMKTVYGVIAEKGQRFIWKFARSHDTEMRLAQLNRVGSRLGQAGIPMAAPLPNRQQAFIARLDEGVAGYLQPWLPGRHLKIHDRQERLTAVSTVAHVHKWALGAGENYAFDSPGGTLPARLKSKRMVLQQALQAAGDLVPGLAQSSGALLQLADEAVESSAYLEPGLPTEARFCHRDLAPHNLLWSRNGRVGMIDFDRSGWDDPLLDLLQLFNHALFLDDSIESDLFEVLEVYSRVRTISPQRTQIFYKLAGFPEHLTRALVEWARTGYARDKRVAVAWALEKEHARQRVLLGVRNPSWS